MNFEQLGKSIIALNIGQFIIDSFKEGLDEEEYNKFMNEPIKACKCGYIKEGDYTVCPKCEKVTE